MAFEIKLSLQRLPTSTLRLAASSSQDAWGALQRQVQVQFASMRSNGTPDEWAWSALAYVPHMVECFAQPELLNETVVRALETSPITAFYGLTSTNGDPRSFPRLAARLEERMMTDGELVTWYLEWAHRARIALPRSLDAYRAALIRDPVFGYRWAKAASDEKFAEDTLKWAQSCGKENSAAAWLNVVAASVDPEPWRPVITLNPFYALVCAVTLGMRFKLSDFQDKTLDGRWYYHFLINDACEDAAEFESVLYESDPAWAIEWILHSDQIGATEPFTKILPTLKRWEADRHPLTKICHQGLMAIIENRKAAARAEGAGDDESDRGDSSQEAEQHE